MHGLRNTCATELAGAEVSVRTLMTLSATSPWQPRSGRDSPLAQAGPVLGDLGLSGEQRAQLAFLLCNENTDDLSAQLRHTHPARIGDLCEPHHRCSGDMKLQW